MCEPFDFHCAKLYKIFESSKINTLKIYTTLSYILTFRMLSDVFEGSINCRYGDFIVNLH